MRTYLYDENNARKIVPQLRILRLGNSVDGGGLGALPHQLEEMPLKSWPQPLHDY